MEEPILQIRKSPKKQSSLTKKLMLSIYKHYKSNGLWLTMPYINKGITDKELSKYRFIAGKWLKLKS